MTANTSSFPALPIDTASDGTARHCGVEIEFAGLTEAETADLIVKHLGGTQSTGADQSITLHDTSIGEVRVELDIALRKRNDLPFLQDGLDALRGVIPVEVVTAPLTRAQMATFSDFCTKLRNIGAKGSRSGVLLGFGVHLNPQVVAPDHPLTRDTITAYALVEPWLRQQENIDPTRRMMPFIGTWPRALVSMLAQQDATSLADLMRRAAPHIQSRNLSLDLLPLFKHAEPTLFAKLFDTNDKTTARPTFHFRLPDSRIDEADWSLQRPWRLWRQVERVAASPKALGALRHAWALHDSTWLERRPAWIKTIDALLSDHSLKETL